MRCTPTLRSCRQHGEHYEGNPKKAIILKAAEKRWTCETRTQKRECGEGGRNTVDRNMDAET